MNKQFKGAALAAAAAGLFGASTAMAETIDYTKTDPFNQPDIHGVSVTTTAIGGAGSQQAFDGVGLGSPPCGNNPLVCEIDGIGVDDDEITEGAEAIEVAFGGPLQVSGFHFLDLFFEEGMADQEAAQVFFNGETVATFTFSALEEFQEDGGYGFFGFSPEQATSLRFLATSGNDNVGDPDYALAGIDVQPVPLPAAGFLFLGALGGLGVVSRKRKTA